MEIREALTFDDVLLEPGPSEVMPSEVDVRTRLTREITLRKAVLALSLYVLAVITVLFQEDHPFLYFRF